jgi:hypothetical protein
MLVVTESEACLLEAVRALPSEGQRAVLSYAMFLSSQEEARCLEAGEAAWEKHFRDTKKMAHFAEWAQQSLAKDPGEPLDDARL